MYDKVLAPNLRWLALIISLGACAACSSRAGGVGGQEATLPTVRVETPNIPVLNLDRQRPLPQARLDALIRIAEAREPAAIGGRKIWFVAAFSNHPDHYRQIVYYAPDSTSPRVRRGLCLVFYWWASSPINPSAAIAEYVQVSRRGAPFRKGDALTVPPAVDLPFPPPEDRDGTSLEMSDDDLAALIDAARPVVDPAVEFDDFPCVFLIGSSHDGGFRLATGNQHGGFYFVIKRTADGRLQATDEQVQWSGSPWSDLSPHLQFPALASRSDGRTLHARSTAMEGTSAHAFAQRHFGGLRWATGDARRG